MAKKILLAGLLGGLVLTLWGVVAWMVLPIHDASTHAIPNEDAVLESLKENLENEGVYFFPAVPEPIAEPTAEEVEAGTKAWEEKYRRGPLGMIVFRPDGADPVMAMQFVWGLIISILACLLAAWLLSRSTAVNESLFARISFCGMLGIFASIVTHVAFWNWMMMPFDYTSGMVLDTVLGWIVTGVVIGAIVKPVKQVTA